MSNNQFLLMKKLKNTESAHLCTLTKVGVVLAGGDNKSAIFKTTHFLDLQTPVLKAP